MTLLKFIAFQSGLIKTWLQIISEIQLDGAVLKYR